MKLNQGTELCNASQKSNIKLWAETLHSKRKKTDRNTPEHASAEDLMSETTVLFTEL